MREMVMMARLFIEQYRINKMAEGLTLDQLSTLTYKMFEDIKLVGFIDLQEFENENRKLNDLENTNWL